ncbi:MULTISPECIES: hypothetical protein [Neisseriaceae]|uniref:hypothetical protein n=1 Tax=Neisseriaceae TaxID=481 RepID=UPI0012E0AEFA|nr:MULTISPECIES: hypothetical protein [Neisseriaceae]MDK6870826.1 hypothetical protein [Neisseria mucosa]
MTAKKQAVSELSVCFGWRKIHKNDTAKGWGKYRHTAAFFRFRYRFILKSRRANVV